jgi:dodecin
MAKAKQKAGPMKAATVQTKQVPGATAKPGQPGQVRVIELVGVSTRSWSDAAQRAVKRASQTLRGITGLDVIHSTAVVREAKIVEYHVNLKIAFVMEGPVTP